MSELFSNNIIMWEYSRTKIVKLPKLNIGILVTMSILKSVFLSCSLFKYSCQITRGCGIIPIRLCQVYEDAVKHLLSIKTGYFMFLPLSLLSVYGSSNTNTGHILGLGIISFPRTLLMSSFFSAIFACIKVYFISC